MMVPYTLSAKDLGYQNNSLHQRKARMQEIMHSIENTLSHPFVRNVYVFYQDDKLIPYMKKQDLKYSQNIVFVPNSNDTMSTLFKYANKYLYSQVVMIMNADTYPGEGFDMLDFDYITNNRVMYSLSR